MGNRGRQHPGMPDQLHPSNHAESWGYTAPVRDKTWSGMVVNGQYVTHENADFSGNWGQKEQNPSSFSPDVLGYPNTMVLYVAYGRGDFRQFNRDDLQANCFMRGRDTVKTYATPTSTPAKVYTTNRAWCLLDLYTNRRYGLGLDISRFVIQDWIDLAALLQRVRKLD